MAYAHTWILVISSNLMSVSYAHVLEFGTVLDRHYVQPFLFLVNQLICSRFVTGSKPS